MTTSQLPCPTCGRLNPVSAAGYLPFCSERCRLIDLGRWLDEEHGLPAASIDDEVDSNSPAAAASSGLTGGVSAGNAAPERPPVRLPPGWHDA